MKKKKKLKDNILLHSNDIWLPEDNIEFQNIETNSCFDMKYYKTDNIQYKNNLKLIKQKNNNNNLKCKKINLKLSIEQKEILNKWFNASTIMYNETVAFIKKNRELLNYQKLRTYHLKELRNEIIEKSQIENIPRNTKIPTHIIDCSIKSACAKFKSAITNLKNGNIKHFRIRKLKHSRPNKVIEIEPAYFNYKDEITICPKIFGDIKYYYNNKEIKLQKINHASTLQYNFKMNDYNLFVPITIEDEKPILTKEVISIDPGIRTFMTSITENEVIKFGTNIKDKIKRKLEKIDYIKRIQCKEKIKKKVEKRNNRKINNLVKELHWKTIQYITDNYKIILIGNLSTKGIVKNKTSKINKITKRLSYALSFYKFRERLEFKANIKGNKCIIVDEHYTSKTCSNCGSYKEKLGSAEIYDCNHCGKKIDRDINGSRGIYMVNH